MARVSPMQTAFNNGEISPYMFGRVDTEKSALSLRTCQNALPLAQGPLAKRDGTRFVIPVLDETKKSYLLEFEFDPTQSYIIEINDTKCRFFTNRGVVLETAKAITGITKANPAVVSCAAHGYANGDQLLLVAPGPYNALVNVTLTVANKTTDTFEISGYDGTGLPSFSGSPTVARIYSIDAPYDEADLPSVYYLQSANTLYLFHTDYQPRKLVRTSATDWAFSLFEFKDGPYLDENITDTTLTPAGTGNIVPTMTSNTAPSGTASDDDANDTAWHVFDGDDTTVLTTSGLTGNVAYALASGSKVADAYWITATNVAANLVRTPTAWVFEGYDGTNWRTLDKRVGETGWASGESRYYEFANKTAYSKFRITWSVTDNSGTYSEFAGLYIHESGDTQTAFNLTASAVTGINDDTGFQSTDVGRPIRLFGEDGLWRWAKIVSVTSTTVVTVRLYGHALKSLAPISRWKLGLYSGTTGWPACGGFFRDRMILSGPTTQPYKVCGSASGLYDVFKPAEWDGVVTDDNGFVYPLIERQVSTVYWMTATEHGMILATSAGEAVMDKASPSDPFSALNIDVAWPTAYGSSMARPQRTDDATLFVQRAGRTVREYAYVFTEGSFRAPNLNVMADHITGAGIDRTAYMRHPRSIFWGCGGDGKLVGMSYEREQNVIAWHTHPLGGTDVAVEDVASIPATDGKSDDLWLVVSRTIEDSTRRYIEYIGDFFGHDTDLADAVFSDSALIYDGDSTSAIYGLSHLNGETVRVLVDGAEVAQQTVNNGSITLPRAGEKVVVGLPYTMKARTLPMNAGAQDGTAQGKIKRIVKLVLRLYRALGGKFGGGGGATSSIPYRTVDQSLTAPLAAFSGDTPALPFPGKWEQDGSITIENDSAYPFTLTALMPTVAEEDGG